MFNIFSSIREFKRSIDSAESCPNPRDPALNLLIYETGGRIGEVLSLSVGSVRFDKYGAVLIMAGKTGGRRVRIIFSSRALAEWWNHHSAPEDPNAPLWTNFESVGSVQRLEYGACRKMLTEVAKRCHINEGQPTLVQACKSFQSGQCSHRGPNE